MGLFHLLLDHGEALVCLDAIEEEGTLQQRPFNPIIVGGFMLASIA